MAGAKDPLRDDSIVIEKRLAQLGVPVKLDLIPGFPHYAHVSLMLLNQQPRMLTIIVVSTTQKGP
jgi:acetyl esterase/lipase